MEHGEPRIKENRQEGVAVANVVPMGMKKKPCERSISADITKDPSTIFHQPKSLSILISFLIW